MPYIKKELDKLKDLVSDFGWESNSTEYDIDMIPDEDPGLIEFIKQHDLEVSLFYHIKEEIALEKKFWKQWDERWQHEE